MRDRPYNVLFICTGNSARSILAEALLTNFGGDRFKACSAGSRPTGEVHPLAVQAMKALRLPADGYRSKSWNEFAQADSPPMDFVITVCDKAAGEECPVWPGQPMTAQWGVTDPAAVEGPDEVKAKHFMEAAKTLKRRIDLMLCLPIEKLDTLSLQHQMNAIGKQS